MPDLPHSPADVLRYAMVANGDVTDPTLGQSWPCYCSLEPPTPDNCITTFDTDGTSQGRFQISGDQMEKYGVQIRIRSNSHGAGWSKGNSLVLALDQDLRSIVVTVGANSYCVQSVHRKTPLVELGKELGASKRHLWVINCTVTLSKIS